MDNKITTQPSEFPPLLRARLRRPRNLLVLALELDGLAIGGDHFESSCLGPAGVLRHTKRRGWGRVHHPHDICIAGKNARKLTTCSRSSFTVWRKTVEKRLRTVSIGSVVSLIDSLITFCSEQSRTRFSNYDFAGIIIKKY